MALQKATQVVQKLTVPSANGATDPVPVVGDFTVPAGFASGDVVEMGALPDGYVPVDLIVDNEAMGATVTADFGLLSGDYDATGARTCGAQFIAAAALGTAGIKRLSAAGGARIAPTVTGKGRGWGFVASTVTTPTVGSKIRATLLVRPQVEGV